MEFIVNVLPNQLLYFEHAAFISVQQFDLLLKDVDLTEHEKLVYSKNGYNMKINNSYIINIRPLESITIPTEICIGQMHRLFLSLGHGDKIKLELIRNILPIIRVIECDIRIFGNKSPIVIDANVSSQIFREKYNQHVLTTDEQIVIQLPSVSKTDYKDDNKIVNICCRIKKLELHNSDDDNVSHSLFGTVASGAGERICGIINKEITEIIFSIQKDEPINLIGIESTRTKKIFDTGFDFSNIGVGGLDNQLMEIFRRAFSSRLLPGKLIEQLGLKHVRGMLLYGAPGCGKTLIARQLGKALHSREPKIVNGPEILNKYVGQSEENIRNLFADAESDYKSRGQNADLHIIIFDEIDAICKRRGTSQSSSGVNDSIVNQLLSKLDGVEELNNILVIGMTNRKDMIDEALLRPGRLEIHVEIGLPDAAGRQNILKIHTAKIASAKLLADDVDLAQIAEKTPNFTGAELEGIVREARNFATGRLVDPKELGKAVKTSDFIIKHIDFENAIAQASPMFGVREDTLTSYFSNGIIDYTQSFISVRQTLENLIRQINISHKTSILSICLCGKSGTGKTALSAKIAHDSGFPFIKRIGSDTLIGIRSEQDKSTEIHDIFVQSYKSDKSLIILDDIENLIEFIPIGPRFSNTILQTIMVLTKKQPPIGHKLLIISTAKNRDILQDLGLIDSFDIILNLPELETRESYFEILRRSTILPDDDILHIVRELTSHHISIGVKKLLNAIEMAKVNSDGFDMFSATDLLKSLSDMGVFPDYMIDKY